MCGIGDFGAWVQAAPAHLWALIAGSWPLLAVSLAAAAVLIAVARTVHAAAWKRAVAAGYWVALAPPRAGIAGPADAPWRVLASVAALAYSGWHLARPPLAFEMHAAGGRITAGMWVPAWVPFPEVAECADRAWPGTTVTVTSAPTTIPAEPGSDIAVAGYQLRALRPDTGPLTDDPPHTQRRGGTDTDPLRAVYSALRKAGPGMVQIVVRPAPSRRLTGLAAAARRPVPPRRRPAVRAADAATALLTGALRLLAAAITELLTPGPAPGAGRHPAGHHTGYPPQTRPADPLQAKAMRDAADKLTHGPHLIAAIRTGATRTSRPAARAAARSTAEGFVLASRALAPARLPFAATALAHRRVRRAAWLLVTATELGTLAHLPADPARHGFTTTARHRPPPAGTHTAIPEQRTPSSPGWTSEGWTEAAENAATSANQGTAATTAVDVADDEEGA